jgi:GntR family transcriptional regulator, transcriptional repressor for pyruvate dehydrogenase complex
MTLQFQKLKPHRIFQHVVEQIQGAILDGSLQPGDTLPSEMKLKEMFETSRGTIREALRVLEQKGLLDIKVGVAGGATVKDVDIKNISESLDLLVQCQKVDLEHLAEFREGVEGSVAALAAKRAQKKDIERLKIYLEKFRELLDKRDAGWKDFIRIDIDLHIAIAEIAANPVFTAVLHMVHENILGCFDRFSLKKKAVLAENYQDLSDVVQAIERGEAQRARTLAQNHVRKFKQYMKNITPEKMEKS